MTMADQYTTVTDDMMSVGVGFRPSNKSDQKRNQRMRQRANRKCYLCYPEDRAKNTWEIIVALALIIACTTTPVYIAFHESQGGGWSAWDWINVILDSIFGIDIIVVFLTAYYDDDFNLVESLRTIAANYIRGWFTVDLLAILPFDQMIIN